MELIIKIICKKRVDSYPFYRMCGQFKIQKQALYSDCVLKKFLDMDERKSVNAENKAFNFGKGMKDNS